MKVPAKKIVGKPLHFVQLVISGIPYVAKESMFCGVT